MIPRTGTFRNSSTPSIVPIEVSMDSRTKARTNPSNTPIRELSMRLRPACGAFLGEPGIKLNDLGMLGRVVDQQGCAVRIQIDQLLIQSRDQGLHIVGKDTRRS